MGDKETVVVGLSGGVDSSVAALILKQQGYKVIGVTMQMWSSETQDGALDDSDQAVMDAKRIAGQLDIPYHVLDFRQEFKQDVMDYFVNEYIHGRTPNPCIVCNRQVKWEALLKKAKELGADYIATGHYARIGRLANGRYVVTNAASAQKDQTYALYNLTQDQLSHTMMPVGEYTKDEIRQMAKDKGLMVADKPDSQEICFVPDNDYAGFIERMALKKGLELPGPGNFVGEDGHIIGQHKGITHYTIGQRRGLGLPMGQRIYVTGIRPDSDEVVLGDNADLFKREISCRNINFMGIASSELIISSEEEQDVVRDIVMAGGEIPDTLLEELGGKALRVKGKIRYGHKGAEGILMRSGEDLLRAFFYEPVRAVTAGQAAVFYADGHIVCGGIL